MLNSTNCHKSRSTIRWKDERGNLLHKDFFKLVVSCEKLLLPFLQRKFNLTSCKMRTIRLSGLNVLEYHFSPTKFKRCFSFDGCSKLCSRDFLYFGHVFTLLDCAEFISFAWISKFSYSISYSLVLLNYLFG